MKAWIVNANGSGARLLLPYSVDGDPPLWAPGGKRLVMGLDTHVSWFGYEVAVVDVDRSSYRKFFLKWYRGPSWPGEPELSLSPDGTRLVYAVENSPAEQGLRVVDLRTGSVRAVGPMSLRPAGRRRGELALRTPSWAPDGKSIAFVAKISEAGGPPKDALRLLNIADHQASTLFRGHELGAPVWSPDGRSLAIWDEQRSPYLRRLLLVSARGRSRTPPVVRVTERF